MKTITNKTLLFAVLVSFGLACTSLNTDDAEEAISDLDLEAASQIIGETVSSNNSGAMSSVYDALSTVGATGISYNDDAQAKTAANDSSGRGREQNFSYSYDPATGTHTIDFMRSITRGEFSKSVSAHLEYIFTDLDDEFIVFPRLNKDDIEEVDYKGTKQGSIDGPRVDSEFTRIDSMIVGGIHSSSTIFTINGTHEGSGSRQGTLEDGTEINRAYSVNIEFADIQIEKAVVQENGNLEEGVTGTLTYSMTFLNADGEEETLEGEIILEGDGTALLRFKRFAKVFRFSLRDGSSENS